MRALCWNLLVLVCAATSLPGCKSKEEVEPPAPPADPLHVPSPDWRDQIIYFVFTDRFANGDPGNDDQGAGEFDPALSSKYSGGDLKGILERLDYIQNLGATAVGITAPVASQWWDPLKQYGGYHGDWGLHLMQVDAHLGTLEDYQRLSRGLHTRGMYLLQDIGLNHMANCFTYAPYDPADVSANVVLNTGAKPSCGLAQAPFHQWNPADPAQRQAHIYHWTPAVTDYQSREQELHWQLNDLDDLNLENPVVTGALKDSYTYWLREVGVDGFRVDSAFHVPQAVFKDFLSSQDAQHPGVLVQARSLGQEGFLALGEGATQDKGLEDTGSLKIASYLKEPDTGEELLPGMLHFPLAQGAREVFAGARPTAHLGHRLTRAQTLFPRPHLMATFLDHQDQERFMAGGSEAALRQGLLFLMTVPGIPVILYGTEQGFTEQRGAMFRTGYKSGGKDHYDPTSPLYLFLREVTALRKNHAVFRRGTPTVLRQNDLRSGLFAYAMEDGGTRALVLFNTSEEEVLLDNLPTGLADGSELKLLASLGPGASDAQVGRGGMLSLRLPARGARVFMPTGQVTPLPEETVRFTLNNTDDVTVNGDFELSGTATGVSTFQVVVDGVLGDALPVAVQDDGTWRITIRISGKGDPSHQRSLVAWSEEAQALSRTLRFRVDRPATSLPFVPLATHEDAAGDDTGPEGRYHYPTDASWGEHRQGDLRRVTLLGAGNVLKLALQTNPLTTVWNPPNGFDHVSFTVFIDVPGRTGSTVMPQQNASLPAGMDWDYRARFHGWSNTLFDARGASATSEGTPLPPGVLEADEATQTVSLTLPEALFQGLDSLQGVQVYVTTWDYDGGYRPLVATAEQWKFWGGDGATDPLILDSTPVLVIP